MENEETLRAIKKELRFTRVCCILSMLLTLCMVLGGGVAIWKIQPVLEAAEDIKPVLDAVEEAQPALEQLSELDTEQLNTLIEEITPAVEQLSEIDADGLNELLANLDPEELQQTIDNLNSAVDAVNSVSDKMGSLGSLFK